MSRIVIIGGHGKIALRAERLLHAAGHDITAVVRNPGQVTEVESTGATAKVLNVETAETAILTDAMLGADVVVWSAGAGGGNPVRTFAVDRDAAIRSMDAAIAAEVPRYIMVSYAGSSLEHGVPLDSSFFPYAQAKAEADDYLRRTSLDWTILGPSTLTDEPGSGSIHVGSDRTEDAHVSRDNVAEAIVATIESPSTAHTTICFDDGDVPVATAITRAESTSAQS